MGDIDDQEEDISKSANGANVTINDDIGSRPIIVAGFGGISRYEPNLNLSMVDVMREFYQLTTNGKISYNSEQIPILTGCPDMMKNHNNLQPIDTSYKFVTKPPFDPWLKLTDATFAVHLGTKEDTLGNEIWFEL